MRTSHHCIGFVFLVSSFLINTAWAASTTQAAAKPTVTRAAATTTPQKTTAQDKLFVQNVAAAGVTWVKTTGKLDVTIDEKTAVAALPTLEAEGVIPKISAADIQRAPLGMSVAVVGVSFTVVILDSVYAGKNDTDKLQVQVFVLPIGTKQKQLCYTFDYDRAEYTKMDLNTLTPKSFMLTTPGFTFTEWCRSNMENESKKPAAKPAKVSGH
jgi:hypothetical protein